MKFLYCQSSSSNIFLTLQNLNNMQVTNFLYEWNVSTVSHYLNIILTLQKLNNMYVIHVLYETAREATDNTAPRHPRAVVGAYH